MAAAFQQALGLDAAIDRNASFFESGGDSALAVQVIGSLRESVSDQVSLRDLFEAPTVAGLTARLVELGAGRPAEAVEPQLEPEPEMQPDDGDDVEQGTARRNRTIARLRSRGDEKHPSGSAAFFAALNSRKYACLASFVEAHWSNSGAWRSR